VIEQGIAEFVAASSAIQALIGNPARFYPVLLPENVTYPCASYQVVSEVPNYLLSGESPMNQIRLQVDTWSGGASSATYAAAKAVQAAIRALLEGFSGPLPDGTNVAVILVSGSRDLYESDARCYRTTTDYMVQFYTGA